MTDEEVQVEETMETPVEEPAEPPVDVETTTTEEEGVTVNVTITQPAATLEETSEEALVEDEEIAVEVIPESSSYTVTSPVVLAVPYSDDDTSSMVQVITNVLGEYQRITYTTEEYDANGDLVAVSTEYVPGLAGLDYAWITGALLFGLLISGGLKLLGRLFG